MKGISRFLMLLLFIIAVFSGLVFSSHNETRVALWLGIDFGAQPLSFWIIAAFSSGGLLGLLLGLGLWRSWALRRKIKQLQRKLVLAENELIKQKQQGNVSRT